MAFDPYQILELGPAADAEEIRQAYRRLARLYHPDMNKEAAAEERFKLLAQAYAVLSDARRRALFDEFGEAALSAQFDPASAREERTRRRAASRPRGVRVEEASTPAAAPRRPSDVEIALEIDLATSIRGGEVKVDSPGGGALLTLRLPPNVEHGHLVRLRGRGRAGTDGSGPGDLYVQVVVRSHPFFRREGLDLFLELPLTIEEAHRGATVEIPTLDGRVRLPIPARSRGGERLRLRGKGIDDGRGGRGDLYVHLCVRLPERLDAAERSLERLGNLYAEDVRSGLRL